MTTANLTSHSKKLSIWMLLLDAFWSHSWFNWLKLAKKNSNTLVFPFCHQPQQGQSCPTMDMSLAETAGSMVCQGAWGPEWPCGPRREGHGHGAHPRSPCLPPLLLLKAAQTHGHQGVMGNSEWLKAELWQPALVMCPTEGHQRCANSPAPAQHCWTPDHAAAEMQACPLQGCKAG